jgi:hypothetical protein
MTGVRTKDAMHLAPAEFILVVQEIADLVENEDVVLTAISVLAKL